MQENTDSRAADRGSKSETNAANMSNSSQQIRNKCRFLTVDQYIRLVCDNDLAVLVIEGAPSEDELVQVKMDIVTEYAELSADDGQTATTGRLRTIYRLRAEVLGLSLALQRIGSHTDDAVRECAAYGVRAIPDNAGKAAGRIKAEIKRRNTMLRQEIKRYNDAMTARSDGKEMTAEDFFAEMGALSMFTKYNIPTDCNLAVYAGYRKQYKQYLNYRENEKYRARS